MEKSSIIIIVVAVIAIIGIAIIISPSPSDVPVNTVGSASAVTATVIATNAQDLAGVQFDVAYDPAVVRYVSTTEGNFLDDGNSDAAMLLDTSQASSGVVKDLILLRVQQPGVDGSGNLATVRFERIGAGDPRINIQNVLVSNSVGNSLGSDLISVIV